MRATGAMLAVVMMLCGIAKSEDRIRVAVSVPPLAHVVERMGGARVEVVTVVPVGADPHTFEPRPRDLASLTECSLFVTAGITMERAWLDRFMAVNGDMITVHAETVVSGEMHDDEASHPDDGHDDHDDHGTEHESDHDHDHDHDHGIDPHFWTSPPLMKMAAAMIRDALAASDPSHADGYRAGYDSLASDIDRLDSELRTLFDDAGARRSFLVFHPAWGHFADAYGLEQIAVAIEGREPKPADLTRLITSARERNIGVVFVQPQFSRKSAETIARAVGAEIVEADPLSPDWAANLRAVARAFAASLK